MAESELHPRGTRLDGPMVQEIDIEAGAHYDLNLFTKPGPHLQILRDAESFSGVVPIQSVFWRAVSNLINFCGYLLPLAWAATLTLVIHPHTLHARTHARTQRHAPTYSTR